MAGSTIRMGINGRMFSSFYPLGSTVFGGLSMPQAPLRTCRRPGCPTLHRSTSGYCERHEIEARQAYESTRPSAAQRGYDARWRETRALKLRRCPLCEQCGMVAVMVHHIDERPTNNDPSNLMSVCRACHEAIHGPRRFAPRGAGQKFGAEAKRPDALSISRTSKMSTGGQNGRS